MKQKLSIFLCLCILCISSAWGEDTYVELCTSWGKAIAYADDITQDYTIGDLQGGTTKMTLAVNGVYRQGKDNVYFQMNKKSGYFKNITKLPGKITKIVTIWSASKGPVKCYFAENAEATSSDATVTITAATSVTYTPDDKADYFYFNIDVSSGSGSAQMTSCKVYYEAAKPSTDVLQSITVSGTPTKTEYNAGDSFDPAGLTVTGTYSKSGQKAITSGITWTVDPETMTEGTTSVDVTAKVGDIESAEYTVSGIVVTAAAPAVIWDSREQDYVASTTEVRNISFGDGTIITGAFDKGTNGNAPKYYLNTTGDNTTGAVRLYSGSTLTLSAANGYKISGIKFGFGQGDKTNTISANNGTLNNDTWTGLASSVVFTIDGASGHRRFQTIEVSYEATAPTAANPTFSAKEGTFFDAFNLTLATETEGATIYYTLDGTTPTTASTAYTASISINATTTVKAIAAKSGLDNSEVVTATYTLGKTFATIADLVAAGEPTGETVRVTLTDEPIVSLVSTNGIMLQATAEKQIEIYRYERPTDWEVGGTVSGTLICPWKAFNTTWELCPAEWTDLTYTAPTTAKYNVSIANGIQHGSVTASATEATQGTIVTLTATPAFGYVVKSISVKDAAEANVTVTNNQFVMPASDVFVSAEFEKSDVFDVTFNFNDKSTYPSGFPTKTGTASDAAGDEWDFSAGTLRIHALNAYYQINSTNDATRCLFFGKSADDYKGAWLEFPANEGYTLTKVVVVCGSNIGENIPVNIYTTGGKAVSTEVNTAKSGTMTFNLKYPLPNTAYRIKSQATDKNLQFSSITLTYEKEAEGMDVTIASSGYSTFSSTSAALVPDGLTAWYVSSCDGKYAKMTQTDGSIPANTGVILVGEAGKTYKVYNSATATSIDEDNLLVAATTAISALAPTTNGKTNYVLVGGEFCPFTGSATVPANKAYLSVVASAASLALQFGDATAISTVEKTIATGKAFNLNGQAVGNDYKGIVIINGKKVLKK